MEGQRPSGLQFPSHTVCSPREDPIRGDYLSSGTLNERFSIEVAMCRSRVSARARADAIIAPTWHIVVVVHLSWICQYPSAV